MKKIKLALVACAALASVIVVSADLIPVSPSVNNTNVPRTDIVPSGGGLVTYASDTHALSLQGSEGFRSRFVASAPLRAHGATPTANTLAINIKVLNADGSIYAGNGNPLVDDFKMTGTFDINANTVIEPNETGTLLTGSLLQFGFLNQGGTTDAADFRFFVTGGVWAPYYAGKDIGVREILETSTLPDGADFSYAPGFTGSIKANVVPIACAGSIGDFVWHDLNRNGLQDAGEPGLNNVTLRLTGTTLNGNLAVSQVAVTTNNPTGGQPGFYKFTGLCMGTYVVTVDESTATGFVPTTANVGGDVTVESNTNNALVILQPSNYVNGDQTIDFGFVSACSGTIGDFVWHDLNRNGIQDAGEPGIQGVVVKLKRTDNSVVTTTTTGANGFYQFTGLCAGMYRVEVDAATVPPGFGPTTPMTGAPDKDSNPTPYDVTLSGDSSTDSTVDFGYTGLCQGAIGDFVWFDINSNGLQDPSEPGVDGLTVSLNGPGGPRTATTGVNPFDNTKHGYYQFTGLCTGTYTVSTTAPAGFTQTNSPPGSDPSLDSNTAVSTVMLTNDLAVDETIDFGFRSCQGSIGDFVWQDLNRNGVQDSGEPGFAGVIVNLRRQSDNAIIQTATTGADGAYRFNGVCPADYKVEAVLPAGATPSPTGAGTPDTDSNVNPSAVSLTVANSSDLTIDFGFSQPASLGDLVWDDQNVNGQQDALEPGIPNVLVTLLDCAGNPGKDVNGVAVPAQLTNGNGNYLFTNLLPGACYKVQFATPAGFVATQSNVGSDVTDSDAVGGVTGNYTLVSGQTNLTADAGFFRPAAIGDFVWNDQNANGQQDALEPGIPNVLVTLLDCGGTPGKDINGIVVPTQLTSSTGKYLFTNLLPGGCYKVQFGTPSGFSPTLSNIGGDGSDSDAVGSVSGNYMLGPGETNLTVDAGFYQPASLGDFVWLDKNGNGQQDAGEPGIVGVTVKLLDSTGATVLQTTTTGAGGLYSFAVTPGTYVVQFVTPAGAYDKFTTANVGNDASDSDANALTGRTGPITIAAGQVDKTNDAGLLPIDLSVTKTVNNATPNVGSNVVFSMTVSNGGGFSTATGVTLKDVLPAGLTYVSDTGAGAYNSGTGVWTVGTLASGASAAFTITATVTTPGVKTNLVQVQTATQLDVDSTPGNAPGTHEDDDASVSVTPPAVLGNFVWNDANANGLQDAGEAGINGVVVTLFTCANTQVAQATTSGGGLYLFANLAPGCYNVKFTTPSGFAASPANVGANDAIDSDSVSGATGNYTLNSGDSNLTVDAGFYLLPASLGDRVWRDTNGNGVQDAGETGVSGVSVSLFTCSNNVAVGSTTTNASGVYGFSNLTPGVGYYLVFGTLTGYTRSAPLAQGADASFTNNNDSNANATTGQTGCVTLTPLQNNATLDAGLVPIPCITGTFDFTGGNSASTGAAGNIRTFTTNGVSVHVSAFGETKPAGTHVFSPAFLGSYSPGLGVTDGSENGSNNTHVVDNNAQNNYVLMEFSQAVTIDRAYLDYVVGDSDIKVWIGTVANAYNSHQTLNAALLSSLGFNEVNLGGSSARWADVNAGLLSGNVLVIAAKPDETGDGFKLSKVDVNCGAQVCAVNNNFSFTGDTAITGTFGNTRTFTTNGVSVKASAFSKTVSTGAWETAYLGLYGPGMGVTNRTEDGTNNTHKVDNIGGKLDHVLFEFSVPVVVDQAFLDSIGADSDIKVWIGTKTDPFNNHLTLSDALLTSLPFSETNASNVSVTSRWADINAGALKGNVLVIAALPTDSSREDEFKISKLNTKCN